MSSFFDALSRRVAEAAEQAGDNDDVSTLR